MRGLSIARTSTKKLPPLPQIFALSPLEAKHYEQGYNAGQFGLSPAPTWTPAQRAGYAAALAGATPQYRNVAGLPAMARGER